MLRIDRLREEPIRRWPVSIARLMNRIIGWTEDACVGGCGYPITSRFSYELEVIGNAHIVMALCSLDGECERRVKSDPRDADGRSYADFRPEIVKAVEETPELALVRLSFVAQAVREARGNLWDLVQPRDGLVVTTNGDVNQQGRAVMGRGIALEAKTRYKGIDRILADNLARHGNHAWFMARTSPGHGLEYGLIFMPVKHHWYEQADPNLIVRSAHEVVALVDKEQDMIRRAHALHDEYRDEPVDFENVWMPRPGCGNGKLDWRDVRPLLEGILDDRFIVVTF